MSVTIPKTITKGQELVVIPRKVYEEFLHWQKTIKTFKSTSAQRRALGKARRDFARGKYVTLQELRHDLESRRSS